MLEVVVVVLGVAPVKMPGRCAGVLNAAMLLLSLGMAPVLQLLGSGAAVVVADVVAVVVNGCAISVSISDVSSKTTTPSNESLTVDEEESDCDCSGCSCNC